MINVERFILISMVLLCGFLLTGCKDSAKEEAIAEAAASKSELTKVKDSLAKMLSERDSLKLKLTTVMEAHEKLQSITKQATNVQEKLTTLTQQRDAAIAKATGAQTMVDNLKTQLSDQVKKFTELQGQNTKLQEIIDGMKKKLGSEIEVPSLPGI